jgi:predicted RND superfamily exporter protein
MPAVHKLRQRLVEVERRYPGVKITVSGTPVAIGQNAAKMIRDLTYSLISAAVMIWIVIVIASRSWRIGMVVILPNALPLAFAGAWLVLTDQVLTITGVITFCVVLGIAVDDTIHMIHRYKRELAKGGEIDDVLRRSFRTVGKAVVVTTAVFVTGLGLLLFSDLPGLRMFGQISCIGLIMALLGDLILLPALLKMVTPYLPEAARRPWGAE